MVVILLLSITLGGVFVPISKVFRKQKLETAVERVISKIAMAHELSLDFKSGVSLFLKIENPKKIICTLTSQRALPPHLETSLNRYTEIDGIDKIAFNNELTDSLELQFDGVLGISVSGMLSLYSGNRSIDLELKGYPERIQRKKLGVYYEASYPEEVLSFI